MKSVVAVVALATVSRLAGADPVEGMRAFRAERYEAALAAFRASPPTAETRLYAGAALYKLARHEEALAELEQALEADPQLGADMGQLYLGLTRYALRLYRSSKEPFERVAAAGNGRFAELARKHLAAVAEVGPANERVLGWYLTVGLERAIAGSHRLALAYLDELRSLDGRWEAALVATHRASALSALGRPAAALDALGGQGGPGVELERGRALLALGRRDEARRALEMARKSAVAPWAQAAATVLETVK